MKYIISWQEYVVIKPPSRLNWLRKLFGMQPFTVAEWQRKSITVQADGISGVYTKWPASERIAFLCVEQFNEPTPYCHSPEMEKSINDWDYVRVMYAM